jgi:hypothetical protein
MQNSLWKPHDWWMRISRGMVAVRRRRSIVTPLALFILIATLAQARVLEQRKRPCSGGGEETWTLFEDDCDGGIYTLYVDCEGKHHWNAPRPDWRFMGSAGGVSVIYPPDFWTMLDEADFTTPGADVVWVWNGATGEQVYFRNPFDASEEQKIADAWSCSQLK